MSMSSMLKAIFPLQPQSLSPSLCLSLSIFSIIQQRDPYIFISVSLFIFFGVQRGSICLHIKFKEYCMYVWVLYTPSRLLTL